MPKESAGLLMYRTLAQALEVFLVHPGSPYFRNRDLGHWGIPKGLIESGEDSLTTALREFEEETGIAPHAPFLPLPSVQYSSTRKWVHAWAFQGDWEPEDGIRSNTFEMEWPPKSGQMQRFPEVDQARWMPLEEAERSIHPVQWPLVLALEKLLYA